MKDWVFSVFFKSHSFKELCLSRANGALSPLYICNVWRRLIDLSWSWTWTLLTTEGLCAQPGCFWDFGFVTFWWEQCWAEDCSSNLFPLWLKHLFFGFFYSKYNQLRCAICYCILDRILSLSPPMFAPMSLWKSRIITELLLIEALSFWLINNSSLFLFF